MKIINKKILAAIISVIMLSTVIFSIPSYAEEIGDTYKHTTQDLILLAKKISRNYNYTDANKKAHADVNGDGALNGDDLLLMIKILVGAAIYVPQISEFTYTERISVFNLKVCNHLDGWWSDREKIGDTAIITSYEEYTEYYANLSKCFDCIVNSPGIVNSPNNNDYFIYNEEYFDNNILLVKVIDQGGFMTNAVSDVKYTAGEEIRILLNPVPTRITDVPCSLFVQVTIPKKFYHGEDVIWDNAEFTYTEKINGSNYIGNRADREKIPETAVITNFEEFTAYYANVEKCFEYTDFFDTYNEQYFDSNILLVKVIDQGSCNKAVSEIKYTPYEEIRILLNPIAIVSSLVPCSMFVQITIPKAFYFYEEIVWSSASMFSSKVDTISNSEYQIRDDLIDRDNSAVITSVGELNDYFDRVTNVSMYDRLVVVPDFIKVYNEEYFKNNVLLINAYYQTCCDKHYEVADVQYVDGIIRVTVNYNENRNNGHPDALATAYAQVTVPKQFYYGEDVVWGTNYRIVNAPASSIASVTITHNLGFTTNCQSVDLTKKEYSYYDNLSPGNVEMTFGGYLPDNKIAEFLDKTSPLLNALSDTYYYLAVDDGDDWRLTIKYSDGSVKEVLGYHDYPDSWEEINARLKTLTDSAVVYPQPVIQSYNLMSDVSSKTVTGKVTDKVFTDNMANFSIELFKKSLTKNENSLVSPTSVMLALSMTANGADGETLAQMEKVLGGRIPLSTLNEYLYSYINGLSSTEKTKLNIANSIWFRDDESRLTVNPDFLQKNADYYNAAAYKSAFDKNTLEDINNWVDKNTDGMIDEILDKISDNDVMYLINAMAFDAKWETVYDLESIRKGIFTDINGLKKDTEFMYSEEYSYLDDGKATGFIKPYAGNKYSFAAFLPNEGMTVDSYLQSMTGESFISTIKNAQSIRVNAVLPKFEYDYEVSMSNPLYTLGMTDAFDGYKADFSKMAESTRGNIFIADVKHKTFISVDELGTKAGAVTAVIMNDCTAVMPPSITVRLDRPFVYAIIDNETNLPIFIGTVMTIE